MFTFDASSYTAVPGTPAEVSIYLTLSGGDLATANTYGIGALAAQVTGSRLIVGGSASPAPAFAGSGVIINDGHAMTTVDPSGDVTISDLALPNATLTGDTVLIGTLSIAAASSGDTTFTVTDGVSGSEATYDADGDPILFSDPADAAFTVTAARVSAVPLPSAACMGALGLASLLGLKIGRGRRALAVAR